MSGVVNCLKSVAEAVEAEAAIFDECLGMLSVVAGDEEPPGAMLISGKMVLRLKLLNWDPVGGSTI